jgi:glyoxylase-like metal-dependent hydrolase (beta-lactamase superfamily II)
VTNPTGQNPSVSATKRTTATKPRFFRDVAPGIHRLEHAYTNCYLVEDGDRLTIVDTAFPSTWRVLDAAFHAIGRTSDDVAAIVLTHGHFDHVGFAARAQKQWGVDVWVHLQDRYLVAHPYRYAHERARSLYPLLYPRALPALVAMAGAGALNVRGLDSVRSLPTEGVLPVPGAPVVIPTPGHTFGHCALHFPERDVVISGDALVTLDPYRATRGPQIVAGAATADSAQALASLEALAATGARLVLPGHGDPWRHGVEAAVAAATSSGAA